MDRPEPTSRPGGQRWPATLGILAVTAVAATLTFAAPAAGQAPQLSKEFAPAAVSLGETTTLTFTVANDDLAAKSWSFTDTLSAGLQVASAAASTDCPATTVNAPLGGTTIAVDGALDAAQMSCTVSLELMATRVGTVLNGASNLTAIDGLLAPTLPASLDCAAPDGDGPLPGVFASCPSAAPVEGEFALRQAWQGAALSAAVYQTPVVGDLFGNGKPAVVVGSSRTATGPLAVEGFLARDLLVYDGATGALLHTITTPRYTWSSHSAATLADLDGDGDGEIIFRAASEGQTADDATAAGVATPAEVTGRLVAYEYDSDSDSWEPMWVSDERYDHVPTVGATSGGRGGQAVGVADFNGDGIPEAYVGNQVFNARTGVRLAAAPASDPSGCAYRTGNRYCMWGQVAAADFDGDGKLELAAGNAIYKVDIESTTDESENTISIWRQADPGNADVRDGFTAVADMDLDGTPDVVVAGRLSTDGSLPVVYAWSGTTGAVLGLRAGSEITGATARNGPPILGDVDGDGRPEIVVTTVSRLRAFQIVPGAATPADGLAEEWTVTTADTSGSTSVSMFDFDRDGRQEIVYRDEANLRLLDGGPDPDDPSTRDWATIACASGTGTEMPVIADLDGSGEARIVVTCQSTTNATSGELRAYESDSFPWPKTRPVWNQQGYFVAHVNDDLTIPAHQFEHWTVFNDAHERCSSGANRSLNAFQQQVTRLDSESGCPVDCDAAPLVVEKTADPPSGTAVQPGQAIRYELTIANPSDWDADAVEVVDDLSGVLDDATVTGEPTVSPQAAGAASIADGALTFVGDVAAGDTLTISYEVAVDPQGLEPPGDGVLHNSVVAPFSNCAEGGDCATVHTVGAISKRPSVRTVAAGGELTYTYVLSGPAFDGADVAFADTLPPGMSYVADSVSVSPSFGAVNAYAGTDTLTVEGETGAGPTTITATVAVAPDAGCDSQLHNQATAVLSGFLGSEIVSDDPDTEPLADPATVTVECAPTPSTSPPADDREPRTDVGPDPRSGGEPRPSGARVSIAKRVRTTKAYLGSVVEYRIAIRNRGDASARKLTVCDRPPAALRIIRAPGARKRADGRVCWGVAQLRPGAVKRFRVTAQIRTAAPLGVLRNRAYVRGLSVRPARARADVRVIRTPGACAASTARAAC